MRLSLTKRILLTNGGILSAVIIIALGVIAPSATYILNIKNNIQMAESQLEQNYEKVRLLKRSVRELPIVHKNVSAYEDATITKGQALIVITELEKIAERNNILQNLSASYTDAKTAGSTRSFYTLAFTNKGAFKNQIAYLQDVEKLPYYMVIDSIALAKGIQNDKENLSLNFTAKLYTKD
jgi:hypothetical protein